MTAEDWTSLVEHAMWPVVVLVLVLTLRRQIVDFLAAIAGRITKLSVMSVAVELTVATEAAPSWRGLGGDDVRGLVPARQVNDSYFDTLRQSLQVAGAADYFVVNLRSNGEEWLTTRLYLFSYLLNLFKGVRAVVFVATREDVANSFLGVAATADILRTLAAAQPWLRRARLEVEAMRISRLPDPAATPPGREPAATPPPPMPASVLPEPDVPYDVDEWRQRIEAKTVFVEPLSLAQEFLQRVQWEQPPMHPAPGWLRLPDAPNRLPTWERASWIKSVDLTDGVLRGAVKSDWFLVDDASWSDEERVQAVARASGDLVAMLSSTRRFDRLIDRRSLLEALGATYTQP